MMVGFWSETRLAILLSFKLHLADFFLLKKLLFGKKIFRPTKQMAPCYFEFHIWKLIKVVKGRKEDETTFSCQNFISQEIKINIGGFHCLLIVALIFK